MIGNMTPQLHVHIVCRKNGDPDWPGTVWNSHSSKYEPEEKQKIIAKIKQAFAENMNRI
jgi:diadenosine tetraphosphate (Ap4A) HIT family hydrolase